MGFRCADAAEFDVVRKFYWDLIDAMEGTPYLPKWQKGVYPSDELLHGFLASRELYLLERKDGIAGAFALNHRGTDGYEHIPWGVDAAPEEVYILHILAVAPRCQRRGVAKELVAQALRLAEGAKAVRLDVLPENLPAQRLYEGMGFAPRGRTSLYYEDVGLTDFLMFEYLF